MQSGQRKDDDFDISDWPDEKRCCICVQEESDELGKLVSLREKGYTSLCLILNDENEREKMILDRLIAAFPEEKATVHKTCRALESRRYHNLKRGEERSRKRSSV